MEKTVITQPPSITLGKSKILHSLYISSVQNRLGELNEPNINDSKRWVWELIQNAKDSIAEDSNRHFVDVKIVVSSKNDDKVVRFSHNGAPFTGDALLGLLYKFSDGKENSSESTGRFGTGFLTTHSLSKIVSVKGDIYKDPEAINDLFCGFNATMYRDGINSKELREGLIKMEDSQTFTDELNHWTTFTYHLKTAHNERALELGLENFFSNIAKTMLFCKELRSAELDNDGIITTVERKETVLLDNNIYLTEFEIKGESNYTYRFIHKSIKKYHEDLSNRYGTNRNIRLTAAVEIDSDNNIVENIDSPSHFCVLPLIGSESHIMPIYLNSPDFEPNSERENLWLSEGKFEADTDIVSKSEINRLILIESISLYESLVKYLSENDYHKLHLLAKGLKKTPRVDDKFNSEWFKNEIIDPFRNVLTRHKVVETKLGKQSLFNEDGEANIIIPKDTDIANQEIIYKLAADIFTDKLPLEKYANEWAMLAWKNCGLFKAEDLCEYIQEKETIEALPIMTDKYEWLNNFLSFIKKKNESLFKEYTLIPNRDGNFISLKNEEFAEGVELTPYALSVLKRLGEDLNPKLLDARIDAVNLPLKIDAKGISEKINEQAKRIVDQKTVSVEEIIKQLLPIINTLPTQGYTPEFIAKQNNIVRFATILYPNIEIRIVENNHIPQKAWNTTHRWMIKQMIKTFASIGSIEKFPSIIGDNNKIGCINSFIAFISKEINVTDLDEHAIIPNQNGDFCKRGQLAKDIDIPEELKTERAEGFGIIVKKDLLHKSIDAITISKEKSINTIIEIINTIFTKMKTQQDDSVLDFAIYLLHFLPNDETQLLYKSQKMLLDIVREFYHEKSESYLPSVINCNIENFWVKGNNIIIKKIQHHIEIEETLEGLQKYLNKKDRNCESNNATESATDTITDTSTDTAIKLLNDFYNYMKRMEKAITGKVVPNQNGVFCHLDEGLFFRDEGIEDILKNILFFINSEKDPRAILANRTLSIQPKHPKHTLDIIKAIDDEVRTVYAAQSNWKNENFIKAIRLLMMEWLPKHKEEAQKHLHYTYESKETIEMNVLWSLEVRQRMQRASSIDPKVLDKFIDENGNIDELEKKKEELEREVEALEAKVKEGMPESIAKEFPDITAARIRELLDLEERAKGWDCSLAYRATSEDEERRNYINGYKGEAYIYSQLKKSNLFNNIVWPNKSEEPTEMSVFDYEKNKHYISETYSKYDLTAETLDGKKVYFEVKSTRTSLEDADSIALPISTREWNYVNDIDQDEKYFLARVFNIEHEPQGHYLSLMGVELEKMKV